MHHRFVKLRKHRNSTADYKNSENEYGDSAYAEQKIRHTEAQRKIHTRALNCFGILFPRASLTSSTLKATTIHRNTETTTRSI